MTGPVFQPRELVRVVEAEHAGRWGVVDSVNDYADRDDDDAPAVLVNVTLYTVRAKTLIPSPATPVPFEPYELAPLFDATGTWARAGRLVSHKNWPKPRTGLTEVS